MRSDVERLVTLPEAAEALAKQDVHVSTGTMRSWVSRHQLTPAALGRGGLQLFRLDEITKLASTTRRRRSR